MLFSHIIFKYVIHYKYVGWLELGIKVLGSVWALKTTQLTSEKQFNFMSKLCFPRCHSNTSLFFSPDTKYIFCLHELLTNVHTDMKKGNNACPWTWKNSFTYVTSNCWLGCLATEDLHQLMMQADVKGGEEDRGPRGDGGCQSWR